ncbi:hypothetical protein PV11_07128 [Exophiala sideris]|uniref:Uncharacterized protein n=1 Tax=Exophiala sideris TaxID=1016849 RepID=A0A0D1YXS4_9EURO|nr:hypothetical protein PV11_07128 [Exophiala sideris]
MSSRALHFIDLSHPGDAISKERQRRAARSHARRAAHAEARRFATIQYQAQKEQARNDSLPTRETRSDLVAAPQVPKLLPAGRSDPFMSFARPFEPFEHFLLDHYMTAVVPLMRCNDLAAYYVERMTRAWVPLALTDEGLICALLLAACRHLFEHGKLSQKERFTQLATQYKLACVRSLRQAISTELCFTDATVTKAVMLAYDELATGNVVMWRHHLDGAVRMVKVNGGPQTLGLDGFLEHVISNLIRKSAGAVATPTGGAVVRLRA